MRDVNPVPAKTNSDPEKEAINAARLKVLKAYQIMDTPAEQAFDDIALLAAQLCGTPTALVSFVDDVRQFFKARVGAGDLYGLPLPAGFCPFTVAKREVLVIPDTLLDPLYAANPVVVNPPHVRFYAGVPFRAPEGFVLGTVCVVDVVPRTLNDTQLNSLKALGRQVEALLTARQSLREWEQMRRVAEQRTRELETVIEDMPAGVYIGGQDGIQLCNRLGLEMLGFTSIADLHENIARIAERLETRFADTGKRVAPDEDIFVRALLHGERTTREVEFHHLKTGKRMVIESAVAPIYDDDTIVAAVAVNLDITPQKDAQAKEKQNAAQLRLAMEAGRLGAFQFDIASKSVEGSAQYKINFGLSPDADLTYDDVVRAIHHDDRARVVAAVKNAIHEHTEYQSEYRVYTPGGVLRWIAARGRGVYAPNGEPAQVIGVTQDITERIASERQARFLADLAEQIRNVSDPDAILWETVQSTGQFLQLDRCLFADVDMEHEILTVHRDFGAPGVASIAGVLPLATGKIMRDALVEGRTIVNDVFPSTTGDGKAIYGETSLRAHVSVPLHRDGEWVGIFSAQMVNEPRDWTPGEVSLLETLAQRSWLTLENARLRNAERTAAVRQRRFVRDMITSVTEGKLRLCDEPRDLPRALTPAFEEIELTSATLRVLRKRVTTAAEALHLPKERTQDLLTAVGEAGMNAVKHGGGGTGQIFCDEKKGVVQVRIQDTGGGIREEDLHRATLEKGWSSGNSLGHGFFLMLRTVDRTYLLTGSEGTTVVLEQEGTPPQPAWLSPDTTSLSA